MPLKDGMRDLADLKPDVIKNTILFGIPLEDFNGCAMSDEAIQSYIDGAIAWAERFVIQGRIRKTKIVCNADRVSIYTEATGEAEIPEYDEAEFPYDYNLDEYQYWGYVDLRKFPVISIDRVQLIYPTGQKIIQYPPEWIKLYNRQGRFQIVPTSGTVNQVLIGRGGQYLPLMTGHLMHSVPQLIWVDYTVGLEHLPADMFLGIANKAGLDILAVISEAKTRGANSKSISADGLSQSVSFGSRAYDRRMEKLDEEVKRFEKNYNNYYSGVRGVII